MASYTTVCVAHSLNLKALCNTIRADCLLMSPYVPMANKFALIHSSVHAKALYVVCSTFQASYRSFPQRGVKEF